jgi:lipoyl(octanoyl) transferase
MRRLEVTDLGRMEYGAAWDLQRTLADRRKRGEVSDQLLFVEHPHVLTLGRNGDMNHLLVGREALQALGIHFHEVDRGGDITYHGPGQIVGYPILDLREWKKDVGIYVHGIEETIIRALAGFGIQAGRDAGARGVWVGETKICALGVHLSRWVTTHGFALNWTTDLRYFEYIVPCGLAKPVTSMEQLGVRVDCALVCEAIVREFARIFDFEAVAVSPAPAYAAAE